MQILKNRNIEHFDSTIHTAGIIDIHKQLKRSGNIHKTKDRMQVQANYSGGEIYKEVLDIVTWLPFAAKDYNISSDIKDYIIVPTFTIPSDLCNRNGVGFPLRELTRWNVARKMQSYKTFKGCPTFYEHNNADHTKAYGVIADSFLKNLKGFSQNKVWKLVELLMFDRTQNVDVTSKLATGELNTFSMGAFVDEYRCSYCNSLLGKCNHIKKGRLDCYRLDDKLVFKNCCGIEGFETSAVGVPAYPVAISTNILT